MRCLTVKYLSREASLVTVTDKPELCCSVPSHGIDDAEIYEAIDGLPKLAIFNSVLSWRSI